MEKRRIAILGSTGSIGRQTLDVIREHRDLFEVELLTCKGSYELMARQAREFDANNAVICDESKYKELSAALDGTDTKVFANPIANWIGSLMSGFASWAITAPSSYSTME